MNRKRCKFAMVLAALFVCALAFAQEPAATLAGKVTDQTGAVIPQAKVTVTGPDGKPVSVSTDQEGKFEIHSLAPGLYAVSAVAKGFARYHEVSVVVSAGRTQNLNITLQVQTQEEKVEVQGERNTQLDVGSSSNAGSVVIRGKDLEALSDDPDELQSELQALAGPSAGPNGGQIYIDGFTGGQLPPKSAIREIRINQNPFSAQYDKLGYGRIEILTKPGSDKFHGQFFFNDNNSALNSRNPFVFTPKPDYNSEMFDGNLAGAIHKRSSFFLDASRRNIDEFAAINATILDGNLNPVHFTESVPNPRTRTSFSPRLDIQLGASNTLTSRYQLTRETSQNSGLSQFSLPSQAYNRNETEHTLQIGDTQILSPKVVNETRFQFQREVSHQLPVSSAPSIQVQGFFSQGGSAQGEVRNSQNNYELQNYTSVSRGNHLVKFGGRLRALTVSGSSTAYYNGAVVFSPVIDSNGQRVDALTVYTKAQANGCSPSAPEACPSQIRISAGPSQVEFSLLDAGLYAEDEWRVRPNVSLTYGMRFESQNEIHDHADFAPRVGIAWGLGGKANTVPKTVLRGGFGIFYDRFGWNLIEQAVRLCAGPGCQQSLVVENPVSYSPAPGWLTFQNLQSQAGSVSPTVYRISPDLRAPYTIQSAASLERQITKSATASVTYLNSRGEHAFYIRNINAPDASGSYPLQAQFGNDNVYQYESEGVFRQNQLIVNARVVAGPKFSLFGFYTLSYANSNVAAGGGFGGFFAGGNVSSASFLSNQNDPMADYGRAAFDVRHRAFIGGSLEAPYGFRLSPFVIINSGMPYNITTGQDNNGDSIFNDRPIFVGPASCPAVTLQGSSYCTPLGTFDPNVNSSTPVSSLVPTNSGTGPENVTLNLRLSKTFGFGRESKGAGVADFPRGGPRGGPPGGGLGPRGLSGGGGNPFGSGSATNRRYNLTFSIFARNLLNSVNPGPPVGTLSSPFFGQSIAIAGGPFSSASANRRVDMQVMFSF